jgi:tetratricopeptide (TPR) repeat protein
VTAASAAVLVAVAGLAAVLAVQTRANAALKAANADLAVANAKVTRINDDLAAANRRERARFELAREAIRAFHTGVSEDILLRQDEFKLLRTKLLRGAAEFYGKLEALLEGQKDRESRLALGRAHDEVSELTRKLGSIAEAEPTKRRALALLEALTREDPTDADARLALARCLKNLAIIHSGVGRRADALAEFGRSRELLRSLAEARPDDRDLRHEWVSGESLYASTLNSSGRNADALESARRAVEILEAPGKATGTPGPTRPERMERDIYGSLALILAAAGRKEESLVAYRRACDAGEAAHRADPDDPQDAHELARDLANMGLELAGMNRHAEALAAFDRAGDLIRTARRTYPTLILLPAASAWIDTSAAWSLDALGRDDQALEALGRAKAAREALIKANPSVIRNRMQMCRVLGQTATILARAGRMAEAIESLRESQRIATGLVEQHPEDRGNIDNLAYTDYWLTSRLLEAGRPAEALAEADRWLAALRKWAGDGRSAEFFQKNLPNPLRFRGIALRKLGRGTEAATNLRESLAALRSLEQPAPVDLYDIACCLSLLSSVDPDPTVADEAMAALRRAIDSGYREPSHMKADTDLDPIRERPDFRLLMMDLVMPADVFAAPPRSAR